MRLVDGELERLTAFLPGTRTETVQLGPRRGRTIASCAMLPSHRVLRLQAGSSLVIRWVVAAAGACAALSGLRTPPVRLLGRSLPAGSVLLAGSGAAVEFYLPHGAELLALMVASPGNLPRRAIQVHDEDLAAVDGSRGLRHAIGQCRQMRIDVDPMMSMAFRRAVAASRALRCDATLRVAAVQSACRLVDERFPEPVSLSDLCSHGGVAERTLEYGFRQVYDTTPLAYIRMHRLTRNRAALLRAGHGASISDTARACGFTHMGQYTRDYRRLFGETPSATLAQGRSGERRAAV